MNKNNLIITFLIVPFLFLSFNLTGKEKVKNKAKKTTPTSNTQIQKNEKSNSDIRNKIIPATKYKLFATPYDGWKPKPHFLFFYPWSNFTFYGINNNQPSNFPNETVGNPNINYDNTKYEETPFEGNIIYNKDTIWGNIMFNRKTINIEYNIDCPVEKNYQYNIKNESLKMINRKTINIEYNIDSLVSKNCEYNIKNESLKTITVRNLDEKQMTLTRLNENKKRLWRLLHVGKVTFYDNGKNFIYYPYEIDKNYLKIVYGTQIKTIHTPFKKHNKKKLINIINNVYSLEIKPNDYSWDELFIYIDKLD